MSAKYRIADFRTLLSLTLVIGTICVCCSLARAGEQVSYDEYKKKRLAKLQPGMDRISKANSQDPAMQAFVRRLRLIDEVAVLLVDRLESTKAAAFGGLLDDILTDDEEIKDKKGGKSSFTAHDIYERYSYDFESSLSVPSLPDMQLKLLRQYYDAALRTAGEHVLSTSGGLLAVGEKAKADVLELCVLLPFLTVPETSWSQHEIDRLPETLKKDKSLELLEGFSLRIGRPQTALAFAERRRAVKKKWSESQRCRYLLGQAGNLAKRTRWRSAIACARHAVDRLEKAGDVAEGVKARISLAKFYDRSGNPTVAAAEVKKAMDVYSKSGYWSSLAALRLMYLYKAQQSQAVITEYKEYVAKPRAINAKPHFMYVAWLAYRKLHKTEEAKDLRERFLAKYFTHNLAADFYYDAAIESITEDDLAGASKYLDIIIQRAPKSPLASKARKLKTSLGKVGRREKR